MLIYQKKEKHQKVRLLLAHRRLYIPAEVFHVRLQLSFYSRTTNTCKLHSKGLANSKEQLLTNKLFKSMGFEAKPFLTDCTYSS